MPVPKVPLSGKGHGRVGSIGRKAKRKIEAIEKAMQKWYDIAFGDGEDNSLEDCPLCAIYYGRGVDSNCHSDCPIFQAIGSNEECNDTPWIRHQIKFHNKGYFPWKRTKGCDVCTRLAKQEYEFLKGLI